MSQQTDYSQFIGSWILIPESCVYEQGEAPQHGEYEISEAGKELRIVMRWIESSGETQEFSLVGKPDGQRHPFAVGKLVDEIQLECPSNRELTSRAYYQGELLMTAQRQLDDKFAAMRVTQVAYMPDGSRPANVSIYRRNQNN